MARQIKTSDATDLLGAIFPAAEQDFKNNAPVTLPADVVEWTERLFGSPTQAYRDALIGCGVARIVDPDIDVRYPSTEDKENSVSGRSLADHAVTPFMKAQAVPISASPYLSSLRGGARFIPGGEPRIQRDKESFDALVNLVEYLATNTPAQARIYLQYLLRRFVQLRESSNIALRKIGKPNIEQLSRLIGGLIDTKSGGRLPSILATALFQTISEVHSLAWDVDFQGINVADAASGAVGDITVKKGGTIILAVEVTERTVSAARVTNIFDQKISPSGLEDYLVITTTKPSDEAFDAARKYTAVGHEINFVNLHHWLRNVLVTLGPKGRTAFQGKLIDLLNAPGTLADIKVAWNAQMDIAIGSSSGIEFDEA